MSLILFHFFVFFCRNLPITSNRIEFDRQSKKRNTSPCAGENVTAPDDDDDDDDDDDEEQGPIENSNCESKSIKEKTIQLKQPSGDEKSNRRWPCGSSCSSSCRSAVRPRPIGCESIDLIAIDNSPIQRASIVNCGFQQDSTEKDSVGDGISSAIRVK